MGLVHSVGKGFFPLDEELELLPGMLTPHGHECLVRLSGWMQFKKAAEMLEDFMGIRVSQIVSQKYTQEAGAAYEQMQAAEVGWLEKEMPDAEEFQRLALVEIHRRGVENAQAVAAIMDGAEWEQGFTDYHCPRATRILDFPHAAEHVNHIGEFLHGGHTSESQTWLNERLHRLKHEGPDGLLLEFQNLRQQYHQAEAIAGNLAYLEKRKEQMQYPLFQAQGWPIGSGIVESGNKLVVEARLKGSGMHWAGQHVNPMLAIRNIICSDRWKEEWPKIDARLRQT